MVARLKLQTISHSPCRGQLHESVGGAEDARRLPSRPRDRRGAPVRRRRGRLPDRRPDGATQNVIDFRQTAESAILRIKGHLRG